MLQEGASFGPYRILHRLGAGGMGEVYLAFDSRLQREVALKVLPGIGRDEAPAAARLIREARLASTLSHHNICTVFEAGEIGGQAFIAMERIAGQPLSVLVRRERLSADRVIRLGTQMADGLAHAHAHGVIHRDLKSANVFVGPDGRVKILDFGLATRVAGAVQSRTAVVTHSIEPDAVLAGTLPYMAPEVLRGGAADARSDIWALGVVLFEMTTGHRPFDARNQYELTSAILTAPPPELPGDVPAGLQAIIRKCLAREPGERYQQASETRAALDAVGSIGGARIAGLPRRRVSRTLLAGAALLIVTAALIASGWGWRARPAEPAGPRRIQRIAVLPLANLSGDAAQDYFADGMTEALITDLARVKGMDVISRTSVMQYKKSPKGLPEIARELAVDAVVEGSVIRAGDRVRITAQLIDAASDRHLWADQYDRDVRDVLTLQRDVARAIAREVRVTLTPQDEARLAGGRPLNPEAHDAYLQGRRLVTQSNEESIAKAIELFQQAIRIDPEFADAWAGLAHAHSERGIWGSTTSRETGTRAHEAITRALALDSSSAEAYAVLGSISTIYDWDWTGAERALKRSIELAPGDATAHGAYSALLQALRRFPEAIAEYETVHRLDPRSAFAASGLGRARYRARQFDGAIDAFNEAISLDASYIPVYARLEDVYIALGRYDEALKWLDKGQGIAGGTRRQTDGYGVVYALTGRRREANAVLRQLADRTATSDQFAYSTAMVATALGDRDQAIRWLNRAYDERSATLWLVNGELKFDPLRSDPRFQDLLRRMHLLPS